MDIPKPIRMFFVRWLRAPNSTSGQGDPEKPVRKWSIHDIPTLPRSSEVASSSHGDSKNDSMRELDALKNISRVTSFRDQIKKKEAGDPKRDIHNFVKSLVSEDGIETGASNLSKIMEESVTDTIEDTIEDTIGDTIDVAVEEAIADAIATTATTTDDAADAADDDEAATDDAIATADDAIATADDVDDADTVNP